MNVSRRDWLKGMLAVAVVSANPLPEFTFPPTTGGLEHFITSNVWDVGPPLTESAFDAFLKEAMAWKSEPKVLYVSQGYMDWLNAEVAMEEEAA